ncbi:MAG: hypothetical protein J0H51_13095 [Rhizobiales bacterium]|nr:hypothetical protein [Hyphomicrobiales bacterium]MBN9002152.1 hypothetical protein [Hyphomicrobiales bacterium]
MTELVKYEEAKRLLAEAVAVDEVKSIRDKAEAMRAYAKQAKDRDMEIAAAQIRFRAERRLGELIIAQRETVGLNKGGGTGANQYRAADSAPEQAAERPPTLEQAGIDRKLSSRAQRMAAIEPERFEALLDRHREEVLEGNNKVSVDLMRTSAEQEGRERRRQLARELSDATAVLPSGRRFPVIYADPPWHRKQGVTNRSYENHYSTMSWSDICALPIKDAVLPDAWLFLWIPRAHLFALHAIEVEAQTRDGEIIPVLVDMPLAYAVAKSWGFEAYSTAFIWTKTDEEHPADQGGGVIVFDQDEVLLLFKRGRGLPKPATDEKFGSNHRERSKPLGHSRKPEHYRNMIATMSGGVPVLELFARVDAEHPLPEGWEAFGNQAGGDGVSTASTDSESVSADTTSEIADSTMADADIIAASDDSHVNADDEAPAGQTSDADVESVSRLAAGRTADAEVGDVPATLPASKDSVDEFTALRALSSFAYPDRMSIVACVADDYIARGLAFQIGGTEDWSLTEVGWARLNELKVAQSDAASNNVSRETGDIIAEQRAMCDELDVIDAGQSIPLSFMVERLRSDELISGTKKLKLTKLGRERREQWRAEIDEYDRLQALPEDVDALVALYRASLTRLHACVLAIDGEGEDAELELLRLLQVRANGNTNFGMALDESPAERLRAETAAPIGQEPTWCQRGVFVVDIDGTPYIVTHDEDSDFTVHAVDPTKPCISETGYRSFGGAGSFASGCGVAAAAEKMIRRFVDGEIDHKSGKLKKRTKPMSLPEHVYRLPMPGDAGLDPRRVEAAEAQKALAEPDLFAPPPVAQASKGEAVQTRMPLDDEEIELRDVLAAHAHGVEPPLMHCSLLSELHRDLIGRGWLAVHSDRLEVTAEGHAWLASLIDPVPSTNMESAQL